MSDLFEDSAATACGHGYARVALERGLEGAEGLTYIVPRELADLSVGERVIVPLGRRDKAVGGYVLAVEGETEVDAGKLKWITSRDRRGVGFPTEMMDLAKWIGRYYCCPLGTVLASMLPAAVKRGTGLVHRQYVELGEGVASATLDTLTEEHKLRGRRLDVLRAAVKLNEAGRLPIEPRALAETGGAKSVSPVNGLMETGLLKRVVKTRLRAVWAEHAVEPRRDLELNEDQRRVDAALARVLGEGDGGGGDERHKLKPENSFYTWLLYGVTGSGKTELYIRAIERVLAAGRSAIMLVPEIALTPQTVGRFIGRLDRVAVLHSGLTAAQRHEQWSLVRQGWARVVIGARSAVFAPVQDLGLIVVDEEHDSSYKQDQAPRYHARDVAVKRAQMAGAAVLLGSATPSLESYYNATRRGAYHLLRLPRRVSEQPMPKVRIVDMMDERRRRYQMTGSRGMHLLGIALEKNLRKTFKENGQAMLLLNRRGFANYIACPDYRCGWVMSCEHCDVNMVYHREPDARVGGLMRCHYCGFENLLPRMCPVCGKKVTPFGLGTQRVEDEIARKFPNVRMVRMDSDVMRSGRDYAATLDAFRHGEADLLVGTQMIAKGLDFPNVRLVGVVSADTALHLPDFRAAERTFQLVCQVAGRAGRSAGGGHVIVQTFNPEHSAIRLAAQHDYETFAGHELAQRRSVGLPPVTRMARVVTRDLDFIKAEAEARRLAQALHDANERLGLNARLHGPTPAPISRIGDYHRQQLEMIASGAGGIQRLIGAVRSAGLLRSDARTAVDVDPVVLL